MEKFKLNIWQRGLSQKSLFFLVYTASIVGALFIVSFINEYYLTQRLNEAVQSGMITQEISIALQQHIDSFDIVYTLLYFAAICFLATIFLMRLVVNSNISLAVVLPEAIEFRHAMQSLGINATKEEIEFIRSHKLDVFITHNAMENAIEKDVKARLYSFIHDRFFSRKKVFENYIGAKKLCILKADYDRILAESENAVSLKESSVLAQKNKEIEVYTLKIADLKKELEELSHINNELSVENTKYKNSQKVEKAQETKREKQLRKEMLMWEFILPIRDRLVEEAPAGKVYVEHELREIFQKEWQTRQDLQEEMKKITQTTNLELSNAFLSAVKAYLADEGVYNRIGGRQKKNPYKPKNL